jgi:hypothetical protein
MEEFQSAAFTYFPDGAKFAQIDIDPFSPSIAHAALTFAMSEPVSRTPRAIGRQQFEVANSHR